ncbi:hypothetical protein [Paenibacillus antibioticophila]|nr:hypothetical protein [Paenibacillus antibioticophila]
MKRRLSVVLALFLVVVMSSLVRRVRALQIVKTAQPARPFGMDKNLPYI